MLNVDAHRIYEVNVDWGQFGLCQDFAGSVPSFN